MTLPATIIEQAIEALEVFNMAPYFTVAPEKVKELQAALRTLLATLPGEGIEEMLKRVREKYILTIWREKESFIAGIQEKGESDEPFLIAERSEKSYAAAIRAALEKIGESDDRVS